MNIAIRSRLIIFAAALFLLSGCATSTLICQRPFTGQKSSTGNPVEGNIDASISGVYLFYWIPLWSGHPKYPNQREYNTFTDYVRPKYMSIMLENYRRRHEYDAIEDVEVKTSSSGIWTLWIFWTKDIRAQAVAVSHPKKKADAPEAAPETEKKEDDKK